MARITLKKTKSPYRNAYLNRGVMTTPASYDIHLDGVKVGEMMGFSQTMLRDGGSGYHAKAFGQNLRSYVGVRGPGRKSMETEILALAEKQVTQ